MYCVRRHCQTRKAHDSGVALQTPMKSEYMISTTGHAGHRSADAHSDDLALADRPVAPALCDLLVEARRDAEGGVVREPVVHASLIALPKGVPTAGPGAGTGRVACARR